MIVDVVVTLLFGILNAVLSLIPAHTIWEPSLEWGNFGLAGQVGGLLAIWDLFVPMEIVFVVLGALIASRIFVAIVQFVRWLWDIIPFKSS